MPSDAALACVAPYTAHLLRPVDEVAADLESFCHLLTKWNRAQNLVSRETVDGLWLRHVADSLQLLPFILPGDLQLTDIGSGGGFPAIPIAIALKGSAQNYRLIEANKKKTSFLRAAIRALSLNAVVDGSRLEGLDSRETPNLITARAVAPLDKLLALSTRLSGPSTRGLFHKGREYGQEVQQARATWRFDLTVHRSSIDREGVLLELANVKLRQEM